MKILNFMNGCYKRSCIQASSIGLFLFMMMLQTHSHADEPLQTLDADLLEFLSLYDADDEDLVDLAIDEEIEKPSDSAKVLNIKEEAR